MKARLRRGLLRGLLAAVVLSVVWIYYQSLVPAIHPDHDHGVENIAGGGFLRVEAVEGGRRNLVGRPGRVLILHWFELGSPGGAADLPLLVDYVRSIEGDAGLEVVMVATGSKRAEALAWAHAHGVPSAKLYVDPDRKTAELIGVRRTPDTLIYDAEGQLVHQARGPVNWSDPAVRAMIEGFQHGGGEHLH